MAYQKVYMNQIHSSSLLCQLAQMWRSEVLCDAYIKTGNVVTKAHRVVLMAACPMLQSMDGATVGSQLEIKLAADIFKDSVKTFLQYLYDGFMMLTEDNVKDVEKIARLLQVENVIKCCADFYKTLERVTGASNYSSSQYKYSFQDQLEFKHVRATDIHRAMQNGSEKRPADAEEFRRKRTRGESFSPSLSPRHTTDDSSFMLSSYTSSDAQRTSQNLGRVKPGFPASQTQGRHVVEDSFEMVQSDLDPNKSSREKGGTSARPQQTVSVTVASQINPTPDVQIITIPDVSEADRPTGASGTSSSRQSIFSAAAAASKSPNFSFGGNLSSPVRTSIPPGPSQSSSTFTGPKGPRFTLGSSSRSETITSSSVYSSKESSSSTSQSKSSTMTTGSASDSKTIEIDTHPEQIIITPMAIDLPIVPTSAISESMKPSFVSFIESESHGRISPTPEIEALSKQERTVSSAPVSVHDESNSSQPSSTPDLTIVKVETSPEPTTIQESDVPSLDMHVDVQPEDVEGIDDDGDDDGSDLEMYGYSDLSQGDSFGPGRSSDQNNSWYIQTLKGPTEMSRVERIPVPPPLHHVLSTTCTKANSSTSVIRDKSLKGLDEKTESTSDLKERTGDGGFGSGPGPGGMGGPTAGPSSLQPRPTPPRGLQIDYANYGMMPWTTAPRFGARKTLREKLVRSMSLSKAPFIYMRPLQRRVGGTKIADIHEELFALQRDGFGQMILKSDQNLLRSDAFMKPSPQSLSPEDKFLKSANVSYSEYAANFNDLSNVTEEEKFMLCSIHPHKDIILKIFAQAAREKDREQRALKKVSNQMEVTVSSDPWMSEGLRSYISNYTSSTPPSQSLELDHPTTSYSDAQTAAASAVKKDVDQQ